MNNTYVRKYRSVRCKTIASNLCRFYNVKQSVRHIFLECCFRNLEMKREVFLENYKKYAGDFVLQQEDAKLESC